MLLEVLTTFALAAGGALAGQVDAATAAQARASAIVQEIWREAVGGEASFHIADRAVSNWRVEAARALDSPPQAVAKLVASDPPGTPRCIKLNNYWCVKRAGWAGEIAADADGHVAFASALEGAMVAVTLLRRYYLAYDRRTAQAIVSRWAPAQCGALAAGRPNALHLDGLATHGIANTLRARWLASHRLGFAAAPTQAKAIGQGKQRRSVMPSRLADRTPMPMPAPEIAVGMGELPTSAAAEKASLRLAVALMIPIPPSSSPGLACSDDSARIRQYALRAVEGLGAGPDDDLQLFTPDGAPGPNLHVVMQNMAKVEIGPFAARNDLIAEAIEAEERQDRARRDAATPAAGGK